MHFGLCIFFSDGALTWPYKGIIARFLPVDPHVAVCNNSNLVNTQHYFSHTKKALFGWERERKGKGKRKKGKGKEKERKTEKEKKERGKRKGKERKEKEKGKGKGWERERKEKGKGKEKERKVKIFQIALV